VSVFNLYGDTWDNRDDHGGFRAKDGWVGKRIGAELLGATVYEVEPGNRQCPYHTHHANEEWLIVVRGEPTLRTPEGASARWRKATSSASAEARRARTR
jgi:uncharacterized cupin superfamily protein